jgi:hypothetical protein
MIFEQAKVTIESEGNFTTKDFGVDVQDFPMLLFILRNSLYSNKNQAIVREYSTNSTDSHIEAGTPTLPIRVHLPNALEPELRIRDFGIGMSENDIENTYVKYCKSTKRGNNLTTGALGIGSKSAFAYADSFSIVSYYNGLKTFYTAFIDESQVGKIAKMDSTPTNEHNGIEIIIPIDEADFYDIRREAAYVFQFFDIKPVITGISKEEWDNTCDYSSPDFKGTNWEVYRDSQPVAVMGNVAYPIDAKALGCTPEHQSLIEAGLRLRCPLGSLDFAANREMLRYTDKTKTAIKAQLDIVQAEIGAGIVTRIGQCASLWEIRSLWHELHNSELFLGSLRNVINSIPFTFNGVTIRSTLFHLPDDFKSKHQIICSIERFALGRRDKVVRVETSELRVNDDNKVFIVKKSDNIKRLVSKIRHFTKENEHRYVFLVKANNDADARLIIKEWGLEGAPIFGDATTLPEPPKESRGGGYVDAKNLSKVFTFNVTGHTGYRADKKACWDIASADLKNGTGVYIILDRYKAKFGSSEYSSGSLKDIIKSLSKFTPVPTIYGFKVSQSGKIGKGWINLHTFIVDTVKRYLETNDLSQYIADSEEYDTNFVTDHKFRGIGKNSALAGAIREFIKLKIANDKLSAIEEVCDSIYLDKSSLAKGGKPRIKMDKVLENLRQHYPLMRVFESHFNHSWQVKENDMQLFVDYINLVEKSLTV